MKKLQFEKIGNVKTPQRGTTGSCGIDFYVPIDLSKTSFTVYPHEQLNIPSRIKCKIPNGYALIAMNKSGIALHKRLQVGACVVDSDYEGEIHLHVYNCSNKPIIISLGDKLIQFLLIKVDHSNFEIVNEIVRDNNSDRGEGGFGSTDIS